MKRREFIGGVAATLAMSALVLCGAGLVARADPSVMFSVIAQLKAGRRSPVRYSSASTNCVLEIQTPGTKGFATLVWLHGGGLTGGRRQHLPGFDTNTFGSVAVEYRLVPEGTFTNCVEDAAAAVAWTLDHIADYGGDPKKVFVGGHSAGGWLTYMVGFDPRGLRAHGHSPDELAGLIPLSGQATTHYNVRAFRGDGEPRYAPKIDEWAPLAYVRGGLPPTCIVTGQRGLDIRGRVEENELMAASLRACGTRMVEFHELEGCGHGTCMKGLAPIAHAFMRTALQPTFRNSLGAANGEAPSLAYDPAKRRYYAVFSGEKDLTVWRARHAADILSSPRPRTGCARTTPVCCSWRSMAGRWRTRRAGRSWTRRWSSAATACGGRVLRASLRRRTDARRGARSTRWAHRPRDASRRSSTRGFRRLILALTAFRRSALQPETGRSCPARRANDVPTGVRIASRGRRRRDRGRAAL